jgi:hypothetical protein
MGLDYCCSSFCREILSLPEEENQEITPNNRTSITPLHEPHMHAAVPRLDRRVFPPEYGPHLSASSPDLDLFLNRPLPVLTATLDISTIRYQAPRIFAPTFAPQRRAHWPYRGPPFP